jgi:nitrogen regulatory protein PII-like uncharacterized protein
MEIFMATIIELNGDTYSRTFRTLQQAEAYVRDECISFLEFIGCVVVKEKSMAELEDTFAEEIGDWRYEIESQIMD